MIRRKIFKYIFIALAAAINIFILVNSFISGPKSSEMSNGAAHVAVDVINDIQPGTITTEPEFVKFASFFRKFAGHFCMFGLSGILTTLAVFYCCFDTRLNFFVFPSLISLVIGFIIALISEFIQKFAVERFATMKDVGIDSTGYFLGFLLVIICFIISKVKIFKLK